MLVIINWTIGGKNLEIRCTPLDDRYVHDVLLAVSGVFKFLVLSVAFFFIFLSSKGD